MYYKVGKRILLVDDESNILTGISFICEREGFEVYTASNGEEAIHMYEKYQPQIVVMDVMMPIMDGIDAAKRIRQIDLSGETRIIFLTAKGTSDDRRLGYMNGGDEYIVKPFENQDLINILKES